MPTSGTRVEVRARLGDLAPEWDACVDDGFLPSPFLRSWWLDGLAGTDARIVCVSGPDGFIGGLALQQDRVFGTPRLRVLGRELTPDHLDLVARRGSEARVEAALKAWCARPGVRLFDLEGIDVDARILHLLPAPVRIDVDTVARYEPLPGRIDAYLAKRGRSTRTNLGQAQRRLAREDVRTRRVPPGEIDRALDDLERLHAQSIGPGSQFLPHLDRFRVVARAGAPTGEFRCYEAYGPGGVVAVDAWTFVAGRASILQRGRSPARVLRGVGWMLLAAGLADLIDDGADEFDTLRGVDAWKPDWAGGSRTLVRARAGSGVGSGAVQLAVRVWARMGRTAHRERPVS